MTTTLWWLLQNTITIAILAAVVAVACRLLRTRPALQHALWLVVLIKFITPPVVIWPWSVRSLAESLSPNLGTAEAPAQDDPDPGRNMSAARTSVNTEFLDDLELRSNTLPDVFSDGGPMDTGEAEMLGTLAARIDAMSSEKPSQDAKTDEWLGTSHGGSSISEIGAMSSEGSSGAPGSTSDPHAIAAAAAVVEQVPLDRLATIAFIAWLTGGLTLALSQSRRIARHWSLVRRASAAPAHLTDEVRRVARAMQVRPVSALVVRGIASPFVWCVGWLRLLWPEQITGEGDVARCRGIIAHELAHVRRRDHWVAWLELMASVVWWWNPLFWYVRRRLRETAEIACDAVALSVLPDSRREYAEAFLELSSMGNTVAPVPVLGVSTGAGRTFERRFAMMLSEQVQSKSSLWTLVPVGMLALVTLPSWSLSQAPSSDGPGSASASGDGAASPAIQPAANAASSPAAGDGDGSPELPQGAADKSKGLAKRLEQLNAAGAALEAEQRERLAGTPKMHDANEVSTRLRQARTDLAMMRTGANIEAQSLARAQRALAELRGLMLNQKRSSDLLVTEMYLHVLGRRPTETEVAANLKQLATSENLDTFYDDLVWALLNTKEFLQGTSGAGTGGESGPQSPQPRPDPVRLEAPDRKVVAVVVGDKGHVILQDAQTGKELRTIAVTDGEYLSSLAFSPDGKFLAGMSSAGKISLVELQAGKKLWMSDIGKVEGISYLDFLPDGKVLIAGKGDGPTALEWHVDVSKGDVVEVSYSRDRKSGSRSHLPGPETREPRSAARGSDLGPQAQIELRVRKLEEMMDSIHQELQKLRATIEPGSGRSSTSGTSRRDGRGSPRPANANDMRVFRLKYASATRLESMLRQFAQQKSDLQDSGWQAVTIGADARTNSILVRGPAEQIETVEALIRQLDEPVETQSPPTPAREEVEGPSGAAIPPVLDGKPFAQRGGSATQLDLVSLGIATIEARGALRLAQAQHDRMKKLAPAAAVSQEEVEAAEIKLHTAQQKVVLLTSIAQSAIDATKAELTAASADAKRSRQLFEKGFVPQSQAEQVEAQAAAAEAKLKLLESILNPTTSPASDRKANLQ